MLIKIGKHYYGAVIYKMPANGRPDAAAPGHEIAEHSAPHHARQETEIIQVKKAKQDSRDPDGGMYIFRPLVKKKKETTPKKKNIHYSRQQADEQHILDHIP